MILQAEVGKHCGFKVTSWRNNFFGLIEIELKVRNVVEIPRILHAAVVKGECLQDETWEENLCKWNGSNMSLCYLQMLILPPFSACIA